MHTDPLINQLLIAQARKLIHSVHHYDTSPRGLYIRFNLGTPEQTIQKLIKHIEKTYPYETTLVIGPTRYCLTALPIK